MVAAQTKIRNLSLKSTVIGSGETVVRQVPEAGQSIPAGGTVLLYTEEGDEAQVTVPSFAGRTVTEVNTLAASAGLNVQLQGLVVGAGGTAVAKSQSVAEGTKVSKGTVIKVNFLYSDTNDSTAVG